MKTTYRVEGMTCQGCVRSVSNALDRAGLKAEVDLDRHLAVVEGAHEVTVVQAAIEGAGFDFGGVVTEGQA